MTIKDYLRKGSAFLLMAVISIVAMWFVLAKPVFTHWDNFGWYTLALPVVTIALIYLGYNLFKWAKTQLDYDQDGNMEFEDFMDMTDEMLGDLDLPALETIFENIKDRITDRREQKTNQLQR